MKRGDHVAALLDPHRVPVVSSEYGAACAQTANDGRADEHGFQVATLRHGDVRDAAIDLTSVSIAFDGDVHEGEAGLRGIRDFTGQQNRPGAASVNRSVLTEALEGFGEPFLIEQLQHSGAFAAGDDQAVAPFQIREGTHFDRVAAGTIDCLAMRCEVALESQNPGGFLRVTSPVSYTHLRA